MDCDDGDGNDEQVLMESEDNVVEKFEKGPAKVYLPGRSRPLSDDEELVMDTSAYRLYYQLQAEAPSLSFDILLDCLGESRVVEVDGPPITTYIVAGTQAASGRSNNLLVMKMDNMRPMKTKKEKIEKDEDSESESDSEDEDLDNQPELEAAKIKHNGTINRVRAHQHKGIYLVATWSELGEVNIWNLSRPLSAVNDSVVMAEYTRTMESPEAIQTFKGHKTEGYGIAWSPCSLASGHLATGDCNGAIHIWQPRENGWAVSANPFLGHQGSVEDIQWSPSEPTVFLSCSTDRSLRVWDTRSVGSKTGSSMITVPEAHTSDVNVLSWSSAQPASVVSGGDDGVIRVWDLRMIHQRYSGATGAEKSNVSASTHYFDYHKKPITSIEWHPSEAGIFIATSEDDQTTQWDIGLEQEAGSETTEAKCDAGAEGDENLPVQLLFIHTGQEEVKECHWHPQVPGMVINTGLDGFNVFRTICV